jgi:G6PDH family F420-dependent oxidoreductase
MAAGGPDAAGLAGHVADGLVASQADPALVDAFRKAGGDGKPTWSQIPVCWGPSADAALEVAHRQFRWSALGWKVQSELPNPVNFDAATGTVRPEDLADEIPHGPDPEPYVAAARKHADAGFERVALLQIGEDQDGFFRFWEDELRDRLAAV